MKSKGRIFDYRSDKDYERLVYLTRRNCKEDSDFKVRVLLSEGMVLNTNPARCLINVLIFRVLDYWKIKDNRKQFIYTGSYLKGKPVEYMTKCLNLIEKDSYFSNLPDDDFVLQLPHVLAEIKEQFYLMSTIVDGVLMMDHSLYDYILAYRENPEFKKIMDGPILNENDPPWVVADKMQRLIEKFDKEIEIKPLSDFYKSGVKVNRSQLIMFFAWG